jgi:probable F420-dependent oxidoreductase
VKIGVHLPQWGPDATRDGVLTVARTAEQAGLDSVWVADHVVYPVRTTSTYPYRADGPPFAARDGFLDAFTTLAAVAGATERVLLGTSVLVLPMRDPLEVAKSVATLDVLSGGRMILGIGAGWWREEFEALGAEFTGRGKRMDEQIGILRRLWTEGIVREHRGLYHYDELVSRPLPVQPGGPQVIVGGMGPVARRRAALLGDGWHCLGSHDPTLAEGFADVTRIAREAGRPEGAVSLSTSAGLPADPAKAVQRLARLRAAGVSHVILNVADNTCAATCSAIERLAREILPELTSV